MLNNETRIADQKMEHPRVKPRDDSPNPEAGVYADLDALIRLQYKAKGFSFLPRQPVHSILAGRHASRLRGRGLNFEELRGYLPGDDIRNIDWKVTARTQKPHVRVYTEEKDRPVLLVVDQRMSMFFGSKRAMKSVTAAEAAALSAWRVLDSGDRVGSLVFNDDEIVEIRPHRSESQVMQILHTIVDLNRRLGVKSEDSPRRPAANPRMFNDVLRRASRVATHDFLVVLISDCLGADETSEQLVTSICNHNDVILAFIYDPLESDMPKVGRAVVSEGDLQMEIDTSDSKLRRQFRDQFNDELEKARQFSRTRAIPLLPIQTGEGVAEQIRTLLGQSQKRGL